MAVPKTPGHNAAGWEWRLGGPYYLAGRDRRRLHYFLDSVGAARCKNKLRATPNLVSFQLKSGLSCVCVCVCTSVENDSFLCLLSPFDAKSVLCVFFGVELFSTPCVDLLDDVGMRKDRLAAAESDVSAVGKGLNE